MALWLDAKALQKINMKSNIDWDKTGPCATCRHGAIKKGTANYQKIKCAKDGKIRAEHVVMSCWEKRTTHEQLMLDMGCPICESDIELYDSNPSGTGGKYKCTQCGHDTFWAVGKSQSVQT